MKEVTGIKEIIRPENLAYRKSAILTDEIMHYCPGCGHSTTHRILAEVIEEEGLQQDAIGISPVGCSVFLYHYLDIDWQEESENVVITVSVESSHDLPHWSPPVPRATLARMRFSGHEILRKRIRLPAGSPRGSGQKSGISRIITYQIRAEASTVNPICGFLTANRSSNSNRWRIC